MRAFSRNLLLSACLILPVNAHALDIGIGGENGVNASVGGNGSGGLGSMLPLVAAAASTPVPMSAAEAAADWARMSTLRLVAAMGSMRMSTHPSAVPAGSMRA